MTGVVLWNCFFDLRLGVTVCLVAVFCRTFGWILEVDVACSASNCLLPWCGGAVKYYGPAQWFTTLLLVINVECRVLLCCGKVYQYLCNNWRAGAS